MLPGSVYYYSDPTVPLLGSDLTKRRKPVMNDCRRFHCHYGTIQTCPGLFYVSPEPGVLLCQGSARLDLGHWGHHGPGHRLWQQQYPWQSGGAGRGDTSDTAWVGTQNGAQCPEATTEPAHGPQPPRLSSWSFTGSRRKAFVSLVPNKLSDSLHNYH